MGLRSALAAVAGKAPVPVFALTGSGAREAVRSLRLRPELELLASPRGADVLLVAGHVPPALAPAARAVHDQVSHPRVTVRWRLSEGEAGNEDGLPAGVVVGPGDDVVPAVARAHRQLLDGTVASEAALLPDEDPNPWRGVGPYGQGGKGMTGGVPYGRPLAGRAPDRDGLELDQLPVTAGPYLLPFPPGLTVELKMQGDVVQEATVGENPFPPSVPSPADPFVRALTEPVPIAELELARARHHLRWLSDALHVQGLDAMGRRALRLAEDLTAESHGALARLASMVRRSQSLGWSTSRTGRLPPAELAGRGLGPVARSSGHREDARQLDPAYADLGFDPVVHPDGDTPARWRQRLAETVQSLDLARRAGDRVTTVTGVVESPRGPLLPGAATPSANAVRLVPQVLPGLEWGDAMAAVVSLDIDLEEAALPLPVAAGP
ncbi:MAG TPA: hypothetical protein VHE80_04870 [Acidimicrobiales bacterium]|nr:hypothetical protein [Acidimicrobiales bacterium]